MAVESYTPKRLRITFGTNNNPDQIESTLAQTEQLRTSHPDIAVEVYTGSNLDQQGVATPIATLVDKSNNSQPRTHAYGQEAVEKLIDSIS